VPVDPKLQPVVDIGHGNRQADPAPLVATSQVSSQEIALRKKLLLVGIIDLYCCHFAGRGWRTEEEVNGVGTAGVLPTYKDRSNDSAKLFFAESFGYETPYQKIVLALFIMLFDLCVLRYTFIVYNAGDLAKLLIGSVIDQLSSFSRRSTWAVNI
jgi:hypothetical protein